MEKAETLDTILSEYDEGFKRALVCDDNPSNRDAIISALKGLQYAAETASNHSEALEKTKFNHYDVIALNETFGSAAPDNNPTVKYFQEMPMVTRRHIFLALIGKNFKSMDNMTAFTKSSNIVINEHDIQSVQGILRKALHDNELFYRAYKETLKKLGKI